jgi:hypothetical protein
MPQILNDCGLMTGYAIVYPSCLDSFLIKSSVGLNATLVYDIRITDKFGNIYITKTTAQGSSGLDIPIDIATNDDIPFGLFNDAAGVFVLEVWATISNVYQLQTLVLFGTNQTSLVMEFVKQSGQILTIGIIE